MIGTRSSIEGRVRARRAGPGRVVRLLAAGSALSMLSLSVAVTGAGAASDVASIGTALCDGATVALAGDVTESSSVLTVGGGCTATLDLNGSKLTVGRVVLEAGSTLTIADTSAGGDGELDAATAPVNGEPGIRTTDATLVITGGTVKATGGNNGAGIGGNGTVAGGVGTGEGGTVIISGGTVIAISSNRAAGIGGGRYSAGGSVTISGGVVNASATNGPGIGSGPDWFPPEGGTGSGGSLNITGGVITATGASSAGINVDVLIEDGEVLATGGNSSAGIGGANNRPGGTVTISGGKVTAQGGTGGAGIGEGNAGGGTVTISGGEVTATGGDNGAGIGGGVGGAGVDVTISGGVVTAQGGSFGGAGIGGGANGASGDVTVSGGITQATAGRHDAQPIGHGVGGTGGTVTVAEDRLSDVEDTTDGGLPRRTITFAAPPPPPAALSLVTQPSGAVVGAPLGVQPVVGLVDAAGDPVVQSGVAVSVAVASGPGSLGGVTSVVTNSDGLAVFSGLSIDAEGEHTLEFTAEGLGSVTSGTVLVGGGAVSGHPGVTVQVEASPLLVSVADPEVAFTVTAGTVLDGGPGGVEVAARFGTAVTFDNPAGSGSGSARVEVAFAAVPEALSATSVGSVPGRALELHLWVEPPATAAFDTAPVSWDDEADGAQVLVSGIGQGVGLQSGLTVWWGLSGQTGAGTGGPVTVGTVTFTITDDTG